MGERSVKATLLGIAQDAGRPQAGCVRPCCADSHLDPSLVRHPVSLGVVGVDHSTHLFEATRALAWQFECWHDADPEEGPLDTLWITHAHLGHVDGIGLFGREAIAASGLPLHCSSVFAELLQRTPAWALMLEQGILSPCSFESGVVISPTEQCGFTVTPLKVPHRAELSDMHAMQITGPRRTLLFLPDHDAWSETLESMGASDIRTWFQNLEVDIILIDGTFWSADELHHRDQGTVPHPPVRETIESLGPRQEGDPRMVFIHLNHTNPLHDEESPEAQMVEQMGWEIGFEGMTIEL